jgi:UDP-GlcNAc:undecaprenyl-phosphate GlcNAc-1-phosphate transferase
VAIERQTEDREKPSSMTPLLAIALACTITSAMIVVMRPLAMIVGLVDVPNARKAHHGPIPLIGGLAIFAAVAAACAVPTWTGLSASAPEMLSFLLAGVLLVGVGLVDDLIELSPLSRFLAQSLAAVAMIYGAGVVLSDLGAMTFSGAVPQLGLLAVPFTVFTTIGVINALNMCDGLDGLSGSQTLVSLAGFWIALAIWGDASGSSLLVVIGGGIVGFLLFNLRLPGRERASIFLGDAGSMFLGFALTWFAISLSQGPDRVIKPAAALWFIMVPIIDAVAMMLRRMVKGRSPFTPDREHLHHIFLLAGYSVNQTVGIMAAMGAAGVAVGLASTWWDWPDLLVAGAFLGVGLLYFWMIMHSWRVMRFFHRSICRRRSNLIDRRIQTDRRMAGSTSYAGPERRSGGDRRHGVPRRAADVARCGAYGRANGATDPVMARPARGLAPATAVAQSQRRRA